MDITGCEIFNVDLSENILDPWRVWMSFKEKRQVPADLRDDVIMFVNIHIHTDRFGEVPAPIRFGTRHRFFDKPMNATWGDLSYNGESRYIEISATGKTFQECRTYLIAEFEQEVFSLREVLERRKKAFLDAGQ